MSWEGPGGHYENAREEYRQIVTQMLLEALGAMKRYTFPWPMRKAGSKHSR